MRYKYLLIFLPMAIVFSCKKERHTDSVYPMQPPVQTVSGVQLKEIVIPNLPNPFYHFEYAPDGKYSFVSFGSDFTRYTFKYIGNRLIEMQNNIFVNKDRLQYLYGFDGKVDEILYTDSTGIPYENVTFTYTDDKLKRVQWANKAGGNFIPFRFIALSYLPDGNLAELADHRLGINGTADYIIIDRYNDYDNKINPNDFELLHDGIHDHLFLLPGVVLQKNNPRKHTREAEAFHFKADYTYTYNDKNAPVLRTGVELIQSGTNPEQTFHSTTNYSYY